ncbi:MAG: sigma 54-interacting transcriptional regulator, partial [Acidobacteriota bacterium]
VAEAIHRRGSRRRGPFLALNLAAIPTPLAAAELFGATKGAYTGASTTTTGYFRRAEGGTLFLDEIGEISTDVQALLLRVLESGEIQPVGGGRPAATDVRLIAATDADLEASIDAGRFRAPLLHRLASYTIHLPRLAERRDDVGRLVVHFLRRELDVLGRAERIDVADGSSPWLPASLVARLTRHDWPGNVRELRNIARHLAVAWSDTDEVPTAAIDDLWAPTTPNATAHDAPSGASTPSYRPPSEIGDDALRAALRTHRFATRPTARALGISRTSLYRLIERSATVRKAADLDAEEIHHALDEHGGDLDAAAFDLEVSPRGLGRRAAELGIEPGYFEAKTRK